MDMKDGVKILLRLHEQGFSKGVIFSIVLTENTRQLSVVLWRKFHTLRKRMPFRLLALVASDLSKAEILIAYPVCNIMEETSSVIVCSVNIGNLIITRREVLEAFIIQAVLIVFLVRDS